LPLLLRNSAGYSKALANAYTSAFCRTSTRNQANNTHGLGPGHNRGKARVDPDAIPELVKNFKRDVLGQPF
jgi:hypothetical protein